MMNRIAISMAIKGIASLLLLCIVMPATRSVLVGAIAMGVASLVVLAAFDLPNALAASSHKASQSGRSGTSGLPAVRPRWRTTSLVLISKLGLPFGIASLLLGLASTIPRYLLERFHGQEALGYFTALSHPTAAFPILLSAFGQAATPRMAAHYKNHRGEFWRLVLVLAAVPLAALVGIIPVLILVGPSLLGWLYRPEYSAHYAEFLLLIAAGAIWSMASVMGYAATSSGRLTSQAPVSGVVCLITLIVGALLIPSRGLTGAAETAIVSGSSALLAYSGLFVQRRDRAAIPMNP